MSETPSTASTRTQRRVVTISTCEPARGRLWGYGYQTIAVWAGCSADVVRQAVSRGKLDPGDIFALTAWINAQKNKSVTLDAAECDAILGE